MFLTAVGDHKRCNINYDASHFIKQGIYLGFIDVYHERINSTELHLRRFAAPLDLVTCRFGWSANGGEDGALDPIE